MGKREIMDNQRGNTGTKTQEGKEKEPKQPGNNLTGSNTVKDPDDWTTGDEPMTGAQRSYLQTLCDEAQEPMDEMLTKAEAAKRIEALQQQTGRGTTAEEHRRSAHAPEGGQATRER